MKKNNELSGAIWFWIGALAISSFFWLWTAAIIHQNFSQLAKFGANFDSMNVWPPIIVMAWSCVLLVLGSNTYSVKRLGIAMTAAFGGALFSLLWPFIYYSLLARITSGTGVFDFYYFLLH